MSNERKSTNAKDLLSDTLLTDEQDQPFPKNLLILAETFISTTRFKLFSIFLLYIYILFIY